MTQNYPFEAMWGTYVHHLVGFSLQYLAVSLSLYFCLRVLWQDLFRPYRIQERLSPSSEALHGLAWTASMTACRGVSVVLLAQLTYAGRTRIYTQIPVHGWVYFLASILFFIATFDTYMYWLHRFLHTDWMYKHVHYVHHRDSNPSQFTTFAQHPIETFITDIFLILFVQVVPMHPASIMIAGLIMLGYGFIAHLGYEFYPQGFTRRPLLRRLNTSTHHNMHHQFQQCNYSQWLNWWDFWMETNHPDYHATFDAVTAKRPPLLTTARINAWKRSTRKIGAMRLRDGISS